MEMHLPWAAAMLFKLKGPNRQIPSSVKSVDPCQSLLAAGGALKVHEGINHAAWNIRRLSSSGLRLESGTEEYCMLWTFCSPTCGEVCSNLMRKVKCTAANC
jgi:hypothetical protein